MSFQMTQTQTHAAWFMLAVGGFVLLLRALRYGLRPKGYPPGPSTLPIIGNLHQFPSKDFHIQFDKWAQEYGPIFSLKMGGQTMIFLNTDVAVRDLLEKRSKIYSSRVDFFHREYQGDLTTVLFRDNDEVWRQLRRMYHLRLNTQVSDQYLPYQVTDSLQLLNDLLESPKEFKLHLRRFSTSIASTLMYGWRTPNAEKSAIKGILEWTNGTSRLISRLQITEWYPFLRPLYRRIPTQISAFKADLVRLAGIEDDLFVRLLDEVKKKMDEGKVLPSFARDMLMNTDKNGMSEREIANHAAQGVSAATDTQWNTMMVFMKAMIMFPDVQDMAQRELDEVVGADRLPEWSDRQSLPYMRGLVEETLRWLPTTLAGAVPHCVTQDDEYMGYKIPKGAGIINNFLGQVWTINNDPNRSPNPLDFNPLRFDPKLTAGESFPISADSLNRPHFTFGAGRRVCPGAHIAERGLYTAISRILWGFKMRRCRDASGNLESLSRDDLTQGMMVAPLDFNSDIQPRDASREKLIRKAWAQAERTLDSEGNYKEEFFTGAFSKFAH